MRTARFGLVAVLAMGSAACSVLLDWNDFSGGTGEGDGASSDAGVPSDAVTDAPVSDVGPIACGSGQCTPPVPADWTGPVELYVGTTSTGVLPPCGAGFGATSVFDGTGSLDASAASCSACSCGAPSGGTCAGPVATVFLDPACEVEFDTVTLSSSCTALEGSSLTIAPPIASGGTCTPTGGTATTTPPSWGAQARACAIAGPASGSCGGGAVCTPAPSSPFAAGSCVMQSGAAAACPAGYPAGPQLFYSGVDDQRACTACACAGASGATCVSPDVNIYDSPGCSSSTTTLPVPSNCAELSSPPAWAGAQAPTLTDGGTCAPSESAPSGGVTGTGATSFCCTQ